MMQLSKSFTYQKNMAASITTTATTLEGQVLEVAGKLQIAEEVYNLANPNATVNRVTVTPNIEAREISISVTLPIANTIGAGTATQTVAAYV